MTTTETGRRRALSILAAAAFVTALYAGYRAFPDAFHNYDGLMFSSVAAEEASDWRESLFQYAGHYLFNPTAWAVHRTLRAAGARQRGFVTVQQMNAAFAAVAGLVLFLFLKRLTGDAARALPLALLVAHGHLFWARAAECSVYAPALFWTAVVFWAAGRYHATGARRDLLALGAAAGLAVLYHLAHAFWVPAVVLFVALRRRRAALDFSGEPRQQRAALGFSGEPRPWRDALLAAMTAGAVAFLPQLLTYRLFTAAALRDWYLRQGAGSTAKWGRLNPGELTWSFPWRYHLKGFFQSLWAWPPQTDSWLVLLPLAAAAGALAFLVVTGLARATRRDFAEDRALWLFGVAFVLGVILFQSLWVLELTKYSPLIIAYVLFLGLLARPKSGETTARRRTLLTGLWLLWGGTFAYNAAVAAVPQSRPENNQDLRLAFAIRDATEPGAVVLLTGAEAPLLKLYLPGFTKRERLALDLFVYESSKSEALALYRTRLRNALDHGLPVYALGGLLDPRRAGESYPASWGITDDDVRSLSEGIALSSPVAVAPGLALTRVWPTEASDAAWESLAAQAVDTGLWTDAVHALEKLFPRDGRPRRAVVQNLANAYRRAGRPGDADALLQRFPDHAR